jgi:bifunctional non-homologous end joining protein LigD
VGKVRLPRSLVPMKATSGPLPTGDGWCYEVKWDGMRALAFVDAGTVRVQSYNERDVTVSWPELTGLPEAVTGSTAILDGELVATDAEGRPSFGLLQQRMHVTAPAEVAARAAEVPVAYVVFDLLHLDGHDLCGLPLTDRRRLLDQVLDPGPRWRTSPVHDDGEALLEAATERGLEGVVAKRLDSTYEPGKRTRTWIKVKVRRRQEMVVGGWLPGEGNRTGRLGALLVGYHDAPGDGGPLRFAGRVGTGFKDAELTRLGALLADLATDDCPFEPPPPRAEILRGPRWVRPELVAELEYGEWTHDDRLRHPSYLGLRTDKAPEDVTRDA